MNTQSFHHRHIGPTENDIQSMLQTLRYTSVDDLIQATIPDSIRFTKNEALDICEPLSEKDYLDHMTSLAKQNHVFKTYIGQGYYGCNTPSVILRNIFENPGWYTQYTPYQAEIAQGRLEALFYFQTMICELTGMELANASLLDEGTAAAEAMALMHRAQANNTKNTLLISTSIFPQTKDVLYTRAQSIGITIKEIDVEADDIIDDAFGLIVQYPDNEGHIPNLELITSRCASKGILVTTIADLLSLCLLPAPGSFGVDIVVGTSQRFGIPLGYGGPHAAYFATKLEHSRKCPGRIIGKTIDKYGNTAYRMALQTREQHIRKDKATSNICTAQALLAIMAGMYAVFHGPHGLKQIAETVHMHTHRLATALNALGFTLKNKHYFDTITIVLNKEEQSAIKQKADEKNINLRYFENGYIGISCDEWTTQTDIDTLLGLFSNTSLSSSPSTQSPLEPYRDMTYLQQPEFNTYHSETELMRFLKHLENKDLSLTHSMIPLGSCTMKLNAATEMMPLSWPEFAHIHPFVPAEQAKGYRTIISDLELFLSKLTNFDSCSLQPNSGAQGEFAGLVTIKRYLESKNEHHRTIALIPTSAHGTNPASAVMAGFTVIPVKCESNGNIDLHDLEEKCKKYTDTLGALLITYPSTHGVFETSIKDICSMVHAHGGQVYMDGANMNAQVGLTSPGKIGADVCHINLHKTFSIPHGGGGPGMGPICVAKHLTPFLPSHTHETGKSQNSAVSATPFGSSSILLISYGYIRLMGTSGLRRSSEIAILNANYIKEKLEPAYTVLFKGDKGCVAHELILDIRQIKKDTKVDVEDIAKRLMDYGYHAPTISWPVPGTMMIEPTESESKKEIDRFCNVLLSIRKEIDDIQNGHADEEDNVLKNAPHSMKEITADEWTHSYSRQKAAYPLSYIEHYKFWPRVSRIDQAYGDRNLVCSCLPIEAYAEK